MRIVAVLRSGGEYLPKHAQALARQIEEHAPFAQFQVVSDTPIDGVEVLPLEYKWPGWWSKMNLFAPAMRGDFLFMDLDTVIVGPLDDLERVNELTMLRDFYRDGKKLKEGLGSGLMFLPEAARAAVWDRWMSNPPWNMRLYCRGDQHLLEAMWLNKAKRWQDLVPGQVVSWKVHCAAGVPPEARVVCMHGQPRPWSVGQFLHLYR
jgi:hypothetical protein